MPIFFFFFFLPAHCIFCVDSFLENNASVHRLAVSLSASVCNGFIC